MKSYKKILGVFFVLLVVFAGTCSAANYRITFRDGTTIDTTSLTVTIKTVLRYNDGTSNAWFNEVVTGYGSFQKNLAIGSNSVKMSQNNGMCDLCSLYFCGGVYASLTTSEGITKILTSSANSDGVALNINTYRIATDYNSPQDWWYECDTMLWTAGTYERVYDSTCSNFINSNLGYVTTIPSGCGNCCYITYQSTFSVFSFCIPNCAGKNCGSNGCGGSCGICSSGYTCQSGNCVGDDTDGDGTPDVSDGCPLDPNKIAPGICGCGVVDTDSDGDGVANCIDGCPYDSSKTSPGVCGCNVPETTTDTDGDGLWDCVDPDDDNDGIPDTSDGCPLDPNKIVPGVCGCGVAETPDTDGDGLWDCVDPDDDNDGIPDTSDQCSTSPETINGFQDTDGCPDFLSEVYWKDIDGNTLGQGTSFPNLTISTDQINRIMMLFKSEGLAPGTTVTFDVWEKDTWPNPDDHIAPINAVSAANKQATGVWKVDTIEVDKKTDDYNDFYFKTTIAGVTNIKEGESNELKLIKYSPDIAQCDYKGIITCEQDNDSNSCNFNDCDVKEFGGIETCGTKTSTIPGMIGCYYEIECICGWNATSKTCGPLAEEVINPECEDAIINTDYLSSLGFCNIFQLGGTDDCADGFLTYSWNAGFDWKNNAYNDQSQVPAGDFLPIQTPDGKWHSKTILYDSCTSGEKTVPCPTALALPFFEAFELVATLIAIVLIYYFIFLFRKKGRKKTKSKKKK
ncbi:MAG: thrombospondin type 3 repeat-containing protein [archaeon]